MVCRKLSAVSKPFPVVVSTNPVTIPGARSGNGIIDDRVIRDGNELTRAQAYIVNNPVKWEYDRENPANPA